LFGKICLVLVKKLVVGKDWYYHNCFQKARIWAKETHGCQMQIMSGCGCQVGIISASTATFWPPTTETGVLHSAVGIRLLGPKLQKYICDATFLRNQIQGEKSSQVSSLSEPVRACPSQDVYYCVIKARSWETIFWGSTRFHSKDMFLQPSVMPRFEKNKLRVKSPSRDL